MTEMYSGLVFIPEKAKPRDQFPADMKESMQRTYFCIRCGKEYQRPSLNSVISCLVMHDEWSCCHYGDTEVG